MTKHLQSIKIILSLVCIILANSVIISVAAQQPPDTIPSTMIDDKIIPLGFTSQRSVEVSGAISNIKGKELEKIPVSSLSQSFAGQLSGLFTNETNSTLTHSSTRLNIRGLSNNTITSPLVIIDGIVYSYNVHEVLRNNILPEEIESISVLKDASTQAIYGSQGAHGVIVIKTKRGQPGSLQINASVNQSIQQVSTIPTYISASEYAELRNQAAFNDGQGQFSLFNNDEIEGFRTGNRDYYPDNNWYDMYIANYAMMECARVNLSGGSSNVRYFTNFSFLHQGGQFNTDQLDYETNNRDLRFNFRSNVDADITNYLGVFLNLSGTLVRNRFPGNHAAQDIYARIHNMPPTIYGPVTPTIPDPEDEEQPLHEGGEVIATERENSTVYGMLNRSGFAERTQVNTSAHAGFNLNMDFLTEGLSATGSLSYNVFSFNNLRTLQDYERWERTGGFEELAFNKIGGELNTPLAYSKFPSNYYQMSYTGQMNYKRNFGKHGVTGMAYMLYSNLIRQDRDAPWNIPDNRLHSGLEGTYAYDQKYFVKLNMGYSGSDYYAREYRYLATPSISGAWLISGEPFMSELSGISMLKLRASYGLTGSEQFSSRYSYLDRITLHRGGPISDLEYYINVREYGNPNLQPEISTKRNFGLDLELLHSFSISVDIFNERMENMVISGTGTTPQYQGIPLDLYPTVNQGIFENEGYDISLNYNKSINKNLFLFAGGFVSHANNTLVFGAELPLPEDYAYPYRDEGFPVGQQFGYLVDYSNGNGFFNSEEELNNSNVEYAFGVPRVGDLIYRDLNNDGIIDERDLAPLGTGAIPQYYFGFSGGIAYKGLDVNFLFQGVSKWSSVYSGVGLYEYAMDGIFSSIHRNAWTIERAQNGEEITAPALSLQRSTSHYANDYYHYDRSYIRLKYLELGYTLPTRITQAITAKQVKFTFGGHNLFTWDRMKSLDFGPEGNYTSIPVYKVYNIGLHIDL